MGKQTIRERIPAFASILGLLALIAAYYIVGLIRDANVAYGLKAVVNQSVVVALVATGAVFIYTLGSFDISLGAATGVSALLGAMAYNATHECGSIEEMKQRLSGGMYVQLRYGSA